MRSVKWFSGFVLAAGVSFAALAAPAVTPGDVLVQYGEIVHAAYADTLDGAKRLQKAVDEFVVAPSEKGLTDARLAWLAGREWYGQTEAFRFYGGPIDGEGGPEGRINGWPMDEAYVDGVEGHPHSGIVNDRAVAIDAPTLAELNEKDGEENIATGWHAIEFLLWGQDRRSDGPGNRAYTEFPRWAGAECRQASRIPEGGHRFAGQRPEHAGGRMGAVSAELPQPLRRPAGKSAENRFGPGNPQPRRTGR